MADTIRVRPRKIMTLGTFPVAQTPQRKVYREKALAAEPTGKGDVLIVDGFFGRMFRSHPDCVDDELDEFVRQYNEMCQKLDEDPAHEFFEVLSYNDLYYLHGIVPGYAQGSWGWTNTDDYRVNLEFDRKFVEDNDWAELFGEGFYYYCPKEFCVPDPCFMEV